MPGYLSELPETQPQFDLDDEDDDAENVPGDPLPKPTAYLVFGENGQEEERLAIYSGETVIGRDPQQCQILIDKFVNNDSAALTISRVHAKITSENMAHFIMPLSTNSNTTKNKVTLKKDVFYDLNDGSQLTFGTLQARFVLRVEKETPDRSSGKSNEAVLNETVNDPDREIEQLSDNGPNLSAILGRGNSFSLQHDQPVSSPTMADMSVVNETPPSADREDGGLQLRIEECSPESDIQNQLDTDGIRKKLDYSPRKSLSETQDIFQSDTSECDEVLSETPPPADSTASKSQSVDASPEMIVPRLRRLVNITPIRVVHSPSASLPQVDQPTMEVESLPFPDTEQLAETQAYFSHEPASTAGDQGKMSTDSAKGEMSTADAKSKTTQEWTAATEFATLLQGHKELNTVTDILKTNSPRKKPEQEYDFDCSQQLKDDLSQEHSNPQVGTSVVTRAYQGKVDNDTKTDNAHTRTKLTPLQKNRFEYFDPKSSGRKSRGGRSPRIPAAVVMKTPKGEPKTPNTATSTGRKRKTVKQEPTETAAEMTTPLRRSTRKVQRIEYAAPPSDPEDCDADADSDSDFDDQPLIAYIPKRISSNSSGDASKAKRSKTEIASDDLPTKKKSSKVVDEEAESGAEHSSDDDVPLIAHRTSGSKKKNARTKKEKVSATPKGRQHMAVEDSPREEESVKRPKRISSKSSGDTSKAKRTKTEIASDNLPTKKKPSKVVDEAESGVEHSSDDNVPLIAHRRSGSEKKEQVSATPKGRQHLAVEDSPNEEGSVKRPKRISSKSSGDANKAKRTKTEIASDNLSTKKTSSKVVDEAEFGVEHSSDDNAPLIAHRRSGSEKKNDKAKKEQMSTTPKGRQHMAVEDSPREEESVKRPKRMSSKSSGDANKPKRTSDDLPTKKKSSKVVDDEAESGVEHSSDDNVPLIAHRRSGSEKKKNDEEKKEQMLTTPKKRQHSTVEDSPREEESMKLKPTRLRVVLKTVKEDAPSPPLHTPVDRRRIRKLPGKLNEVPEEESPTRNEEIAARTPLLPESAPELSAADDISLAGTTPRPQRTRSTTQATPTSAVWTSSRKTSSARWSTRKKSDSDGVRILLSLACKQDEELIRIVESFGEAESICEATHFVANQPRRTCKLVASAARGIPIVTSEWLLACKKKGKLVDTKEFALEGNIAGCDLSSSIANSRERGRILDGWSIALTEGAEPSTEELSEVVKAAGGTLVESLTQDCRLLVAKREERAAALVNDAIERRIPIVEGRMLLQAILEHRTDFRDPRLALKF